MNEAMSFVWFKTGSLSIQVTDESHILNILTAMG